MYVITIFKQVVLIVLLPFVIQVSLAQAQVWKDVKIIVYIITEKWYKESIFRLCLRVRHYNPSPSSSGGVVFWPINLIYSCYSRWDVTVYFVYIIPVFIRKQLWKVFISQWCVSVHPTPLYLHHTRDDAEKQGMTSEWHGRVAHLSCSWIWGTTTWFLDMI